MALGLGRDLKYHLFDVFLPSRLFRTVCRVVPPRRAWKGPRLHLPTGFTNFSPENKAGTPPTPNSAHCQQGRGEKSAFLGCSSITEPGFVSVCRKSNPDLKTKSALDFRRGSGRVSRARKFMKNERGAGKERRRRSSRSYLGHEETQQGRKMREESSGGEKKARLYV